MDYERCRARYIYIYIYLFFFPLAPDVCIHSGNSSRVSRKHLGLRQGKACWSSPSSPAQSHPCPGGAAIPLVCLVGWFVLVGRDGLGVRGRGGGWFCWAYFFFLLSSSQGGINISIFLCGSDEEKKKHKQNETLLQCETHASFESEDQKSCNIVKRGERGEGVEKKREKKNLRKKNKNKKKVRIDRCN